MASVIVGRANCPECGFKSAHVKKSEKCHYRYCPECGSQHHARTPRQVTDLLSKTRMAEPTPTPTPTGTSAPEAKGAEPTPTPTDSEPKQASTTPTPTPTATEPKRRGLFS
jgi:hypothetical protein